MKLRLLTLSFAALTAYAQTPPTVVISPVPKLQFFDNNGKPLASGCVATYSAGTTTPLQTFTDSTGMVPNQNPVMLDASGRAAIWISVPAIKYVVKQKSGSSCSLTQGTVISTSDGVQDSGLRLRSDLSAGGGAGMIGYTPPGGTVPITIGGALGVKMLDIGFSSLSNGCVQAAAAPRTLLVTAGWSPPGTMNCAANVEVISGGIVHSHAPISGIPQVITFSGSFSCPPRQQCLDITAGGPGSIIFSNPNVKVRSEWFGAKCDGTTDDTSAIAGASNAFPVLSTNPQSLITRQGAVGFPNGNCVVSSTLNWSSYSTYESDNLTYLQAAANFAPASGAEKFVINIINASGIGTVPNNNFFFRMKGIGIDCSLAGNDNCSGINGNLSINSKIENAFIIFHNRGIVVGGGTAALDSSADNVLFENLDLAATRIMGTTVCSQALSFPQSTSTNTVTFIDTKIAVFGSSGTSFCKTKPAIEIGANVAGVTFDGLNFEGLDGSWPVSIDGFQDGPIHIRSSTFAIDSCSALANNPYVIFIGPQNPAVSDIEISGNFFLGFATGINYPSISYVQSGNTACGDTTRIGLAAKFGGVAHVENGNISTVAGSISAPAGAVSGNSMATNCLQCATEAAGSANNALVLTPPPGMNGGLVPGNCFSVLFNHSLQAGANTITIPALNPAAIPLKSHFDYSANITTAYPTEVNHVIFVCNANAAFVDMSQ